MQSQLLKPHASKDQVWGDQEGARHQLAVDLSQPELFEAIEVGSLGRLRTRRIDWSTYWRPVFALRNTDLNSRIAALCSAWERYISSGFQAEHAPAYCLRYSSLLEAIASLQAETPDSEFLRRATAAVVGFECLAILDSDTFSMPFAATTTTLRNPVYLLARLKWPDVPHSTRFLPLITLGGGGVAAYSHYRRYRLSDDGDFSLLIYPRNDPAGHPRSLAAVAKLANTMGMASDPFVADRAARLWNHVLQPLSFDAASPGDVGRVHFLEIGAGTGALVAALSEHLVNSPVGSGLKLRILLVETSASTLSPRFSSDSLREHVENLAVVNNDYRRWLSEAPALPVKADLRIAFACKVFDMMSHFEVQTHARGTLPAPPAEDAWFSESQRSIVNCLRTKTFDPDSLLVSSHRFQVEDGHILSQAALSDYFASVGAVSTKLASGRHAALVLPVRLFDPSSLVTSNGRSVIAAVLSRCDYLVIEDADLRPRELLTHLRQFRLADVAVQDMTTAMGLLGNYAYVLWNRANATPSLSGYRIA